MRFSKSKCWIPHLAIGNRSSMDSLGVEMLERSPTERDLGVLVDGKLNVSQPWSLAATSSNHILGCLQHKADVTCPVCQGTPEDVISPCQHQFCLGCILRWAKRSINCPLCRQDITSISLSKGQVTKEGRWHGFLY
uniref:RING-type domain-containing protein n=1 Tax=Anser brachyrhynchus TaxID=132585 RepID=A0A8B9BZM1_9AVES